MQCIGVLRKGSFKMTTYFLVVEDFARASIGPFDTVDAATAHYRWTKDVRGDGADLIGVCKDAHDPEADLILTPEADKAVAGEDCD